MYKNFESIEPSSRVWIYQSKTVLNHEQLSLVNALLKDFCENWQSHQVDLEASYKIEAKKFIAIVVNESVYNASGCSIDKSVAIINKIKDETGVDFLQKDFVWIKAESEIVIALKDIKKAVEASVLNPNTLVYNTLVKSKSDFDNNFLTKASQTWLNRYFVMQEKH